MNEFADNAIFGRDRELAEVESALAGTGFAGVVIEGERGMGKSRLGARVHADRGGQEIWIRGDRVLGAVPFGAFGIVVGLDGHPQTLLSRVVAAMTAGTGTPALFVDDAHHLDESSLSALWQLAGDGEIKVVAMMRPTPDGRSGSFGELISDGLLHHVRLDPLDLTDLGAMLEHHLGGTVTRGVLDVAAFHSSRVPGRVIELLRYFRRRVRLLCRRGVWLIDGLDVEYDARVRDVVSNHLAFYTEKQREALELVVLAGEIEVQRMLAYGLGEAADSLVSARVLELDYRSGHVYTCVESHSTETLRRTVPVGRSRQMYAFVEAEPGTPSERGRMLRADWGLSCGIRVSAEDSIEAARIAARLGEWQRALSFLTEVPAEVMDAPALFELGKLYCDVNLIPVGCDILAQSVQKADCPFLVIEAFVVWVLRDIERQTPPLSVGVFRAALDRIEAAADGDAKKAKDVAFARAALERIGSSSWEGLPGDDGPVLEWPSPGTVPEPLRVSIAIVVVAKELERGRGCTVLGSLDDIEEASTAIGTVSIMLDLARAWALLQIGRSEAAEQVLTVSRSNDVSFCAAASGARDLVATRILAEQGQWEEAYRRSCAAVEAIIHWNQYEFAALALAQAEYAAMMTGNDGAAEDFDARYRALPAPVAYVESRRSQILHLVVRAKLTGEQACRDELEAAVRDAEDQGALAAAACARIELFRHFGDYDAEAMCRLAAAIDGCDRDGRLLARLGCALHGEDPDALAALADDVSPAHPDLAGRCRTLADGWWATATRAPAKTHRLHSAGLTKREREISALIVNGMTNAEIAAELGVAVRTVEGHTYRMFQKLDISTRREVADAIARDASA